MSLTLRKSIWYSWHSREACTSSVEVVAIPKRHYESCVRDSLHRREKPLRKERLAGPLIFPASLRNSRFPASAFARSNCSRMILPTGTPVRRAVSASQAASSSGRRTVIVSLICHKCITFTLSTSTRLLTIHRARHSSWPGCATAFHKLSRLNPSQLRRGVQVPPPLLRRGLGGG